MGNGVDGRAAVVRLADEDPQWLPAVRAALTVAIRANGESFPGGLILSELQRGPATRTWYPNFRRLVTFGILVRSQVATGRQHPRYEMPDIAGIARGLAEVDAQQAHANHRTLSFASLGRSGRRDLGARSEELLRADFPRQ